jgi:hypothetical protein
VPYLITAASELQALQYLLETILQKGSNVGGYREVLSYFTSIEFSPASWRAFVQFADTFLETTEPLGRTGMTRATRVYTTLKDRRSKPSYLARLVSYPSNPHVSSERPTVENQIDNIVVQLCSKPGYSCLSFVFFHPSDLRNMFRPGSVPCPIAGDVKYRNGRLHLNILFRTNDALTLGYADILYLRSLQIELLNRVIESDRKGRFDKAQVGQLNLLFSRTYVPKSVKLRNGKSINGLLMAQSLVKAIQSELLP